MHFDPNNMMTGFVVGAWLSIWVGKCPTPIACLGTAATIFFAFTN